MGKLSRFCQIAVKALFACSVVISQSSSLAGEEFSTQNSQILSVENQENFYGTKSITVQPISNQSDEMFRMQTTRNNGAENRHRHLQPVKSSGEAFKVIANGNGIGSEEKERNASLKANQPPECSKYYYLMIGFASTTAMYASVIIFIWITVSFQYRRKTKSKDTSKEKSLCSGCSRSEISLKDTIPHFNEIYASASEVPAASQQRKPSKSRSSSRCEKTFQNAAFDSMIPIADEEESRIESLATNIPCEPQQKQTVENQLYEIRSLRYETHINEVDASANKAHPRTQQEVKTMKPPRGFRRTRSNDVPESMSSYRNEKERLRISEENKAYRKTQQKYKEEPRTFSTNTISDTSKCQEKLREEVSHEIYANVNRKCSEYRIHKH